MHLNWQPKAAICQLNISQHCWAQHVACVWPPCCDMLGVVGSSLKMVKFEPTTPNKSQHGGQTHATCCTNSIAICCVGMLRSFGRGLRTFAPIVSVHPYCVRKFTCHVIHRARALSTKMNNERAGGH